MGKYFYEVTRGIKYNLSIVTAMYGIYKLNQLMLRKKFLLTVCPFIIAHFINIFPSFC